MLDSNFIKTFIEEDIKTKNLKKIITRFPPEPNGFLHIGHARAIITDFEMAKLFKGYTNLRYDDTNPEKENKVYVDSILKDIKWLGYKPKHVFFASDYFDYMYDRALFLIKNNLAYVDDQSQEVISKTRGDLYNPGKESPFRNRSIEENLKLFEEMKDGVYPEGAKVLRAKIDMSSNNINMRDPVLYRISFLIHHRQLDKYKIYPMYDFAHPLEDAVEGITHSLCSLEFEDHRALYDWVIDNCQTPKKPRQIEFGRLSLENTVMSKRYLRQLVEEKKVSGWDDPRLPTLSGMRRLGYTKEAIRAFILSAGLSKINSTISKEMLQSALRDDLSFKTKRVATIIKPIKVIVTNYESDIDETLVASFNQDNLELGSRDIYFGKELYISQDDFSEIKPDKNYKRLSLGGEVRLMNAYFIKCNEVIKNEDGSIKELLCTYDPATKNGLNFKERKPDGTIHYLSAKHYQEIFINFYEDLINNEIESDDILEKFNKNSLKTVSAYIEPDLLLKPLTKYQFVRLGYFSVDTKKIKKLITFNRTVDLKSSYKPV